MDAKAKKLWMIYQQSPKSLSQEELKYLAPAIREALKSAEKVLSDMKREHPFWYYTPTVGTLKEEARAFLLRHLKPEDIPQKLDGGLDFHLSEKPTRIISGGNQSSKSYSTAADNYILVTGRVPYCFDSSKPNFYKGWNIPASRLKREGPVHIRVIGFDWENDVVKNLLPKYRELAPKEFLIDGSFDKSYVSGESTLYLRDGRELLGTIEFMSNKQDLTSFGGPPRQRVCFDEEPFEAVYKENVARMVTSTNFEVIFSMTPTNGMSWTYEALREKWEGGDKSIDWFQVPSLANPRANIKSLEEMVKPLEYNEKKNRLLGEYYSVAGLVYGSAFQRDIHVIPPFETGCTCRGEHNTNDDACQFENFMHFLGIDAHSVKPTVAVNSCIDREGNYFVDRCYKRAADTEELKADIAGPGGLIDKKRLDFSVFDPSNDSTIEIFGGLNIYRLMTKGANRIPRARKGLKYAGSKAAGIQEVKRRLKVNASGKPSFFIFDRPENQGLIKSMRTMQIHHIDNPALKGQPDEILEGMEDEHAANRYILQNKLIWKDHMSVAPANFIPDEVAALV